MGRRSEIGARSTGVKAEPQGPWAGPDGVSPPRHCSHVQQVPLQRAGQGALQSVSLCMVKSSPPVPARGCAQPHKGSNHSSQFLLLSHGPQGQSWGTWGAASPWAGSRGWWGHSRSSALVQRGHRGAEDVQWWGHRLQFLAFLWVISTAPLTHQQLLVSPLLPPLRAG